MSRRRWTPLFFVPTPLLRVLLGDRWWWVPLVLCAVGFLGLSWLSIVEYGWVGGCFGLLYLAVSWAIVARLYMHVLRDELCLRLGLPSVVWWWFVAHVGWFLPGTPLWTVLDHHGEAESPFADRLRLWVDARGEVRGVLERWTVDGTGDATRTTTELGGAAGVELLAALEDFREAGFPWDEELGLSSPTFAPPATAFLRRGCLPARSWPSGGMHWSGLGRFWGAWSCLRDGPGPTGLLLDPRTPRLSVASAWPLELGDEESTVRRHVGRFWEVHRELSGDTTMLRWPDLGLTVELDEAGCFRAVELRTPADGYIRFGDDDSVPMSFTDSGGALVSALVAFAAGRGHAVQVEGSRFELPTLGLRFDFDAPLPEDLTPPETGAAAPNFPTLTQVTLRAPEEERPA